MIDICNCCNGCSLTRQLSTYPRYSFPKKLLVAIALAVVTSMFVTPTEARAVEKRRHSHANMAYRDIITLQSLDASKIRHHKRLENLTRITKDTRTKPYGQKHKTAELYKKEMKKVLRKIRNTNSFMAVEQELQSYSETPPSWLPRVNFVDIHYYDYNKKMKGASTKPERIFKRLMPKLYKSLIDYEDMFKLFQKMELNFPDTPINSYKSKRKRKLKNILQHLYSTVQEVYDSMVAVNMKIPEVKRKDFSSLETSVDQSQCLRLDYLAQRGYKNLLNNWTKEIRCQLRTCKKSPLQQRQLCDQWEKKLSRRKSPNMNKR